VAEVYIEGKKLDVFQGFKFSFNYSIADIRHPEKRSTTYSKTIQCPGTQTNDEIFGQIYDFNISNGYDGTEPNIDVNFNPNKKAEASVQADGVEVMRGSIQLRKIKRKKSDYIYEVVFVGRLVDIFGVLGDKQLSGLDNDGVRLIDFSDLDHYYTQANQSASWTAPFGSGYVYPMLDYGKFVGYDSQGLRKYFVTDFKPALYLKDILDRIFTFAGFSYTSSFLSSDFFKRLVVPISSKTKEDTKRLFRASVPKYDTIFESLNNEQLLIRGESVLGANTIVPLAIGNDSRIGYNLAGLALLCFSNDSTNGNFDNGTYTNFGNYWVNPTVYPNTPGVFSVGWQTLDSGSYSFRPNEETAGHYNLTCNLRFTWREQGLGNQETMWTEFVQNIQDTYGLTQGENLQGKVKIQRRRVNLSGGYTISTIQEEDISIPINQFTGTTLVYGQQNVEIFAESVECLDGDAIFIALHFPQSTDAENATGFSPELAYWDGPNGRSYDLWLTVGGSFYNEQTAGADIVDSEFLQFNGNTPEVGMSDLLLSVINMFNLYVLPDPDNDKNLLIETRDDFYEGGSVKDWTHKVDHSKEFTLEPLALLTANEYEYTYTEDEDYYNERYQDSHGHAYGRARIDIDNDFLNNTNTTEVVFSPTPLVNDNPSNRIIGKIYDSDIEEGAQPTDHNVRVLYYGGLLESNPKWIHASVVDDWLYPLQYPYAGHLTHPLAPAQDINFGIPNELFYSQNSYTGTLLYTNDNLFNRYHRRGLLEATNKDSKMLTAYLYLEPLDIHKLDFRDQIVIDNSYWRINRIMDYNPFSEGLTKVELIKVITKEPLKVETFNVGSGGTTGTAGNIEKKPINRRSLKNGNSLPLFGGVVRGTDNNIEDGVTSFMVQGNRNRIKKGSEDITISGDDNTVEGGLRSVRLINTNGVTVTESNVTFVNNRQQESSEVLDGGLDTVRRIGGGSNIFTVDGGLNIVQAQFSETSIYIIEGGDN